MSGPFVYTPRPPTPFEPERNPRLSQFHDLHLTSLSPYIPAELEPCDESPPGSPTPTSHSCPIPAPGRCLWPYFGSIRFDLSNPKFLPLGGDWERIPRCFLTNPAAFNQQSRRLVIKSDKVPHWDITIDLGQTPDPPIVVGDVFYAIHQKMRTPITNEDREQSESSLSEWKQVDEAYRRRCEHHKLPADEEGGRMIDYFGKEIMFAGLFLENSDEEIKNFKLFVEERVDSPGSNGANPDVSEPAT